MANNYKELYKKIGYYFEDENIIEKSLTHKSKDRKNNERLEFLGDSILNFIIAENLYKEYPTKDEGKLSLLRINLVQGKTLTSIAKKFNLGKYISLGLGEVKNGRNRAKLLEDSLEALIGGIYLDSSLDKVKELVLSWYSEIFQNLNVEISNYKDPKSQLQEYLQAKIQSHPTYNVISSSGKDHEKTFLVEVSLKKLEKRFIGEGKSLKFAEFNAALKALKDLKEN